RRRRGRARSRPRPQGAGRRAPPRRSRVQGTSRRRRPRRRPAPRRAGEGGPETTLARRTAHGPRSATAKTPIDDAAGPLGPVNVIEHPPEHGVGTVPVLSSRLAPAPTAPSVSRMAAPAHVWLMPLTVTLVTLPLLSTA